MVTEESRVGVRTLGSTPVLGKAGEHPDTYVPWWIDGRKRCYLGNRNKGKTKELWEDVYAAWIRYRLTEPIQDGRIHEKDEENMRLTWGHHLQILTVDVQEE